MLKDEINIIKKAKYAGELREPIVSALTNCANILPIRVNITDELTILRKNESGESVRAAICSALKKINNVLASYSAG